MYKLFLFVFLLCSSEVLATTETCLDYYRVGTTACANQLDEAEPESRRVEPDVSKTMHVMPEAEPLSEEDMLEQKVDEFLEGYGKPPREYVRFNLNPTLENALIWAQKFEEMNNRSRAVSNAWGQAQEILQKRRDQGLDLPEFERDAEVPDYTKVGEGAQNRWLPLPPNVDGPPALGFNSVGNNGIVEQNSGLNIRAESLTNGSIGGAIEQELREQGPIEISYYFSAQCPYCKKFEPQLQSLIRELGEERVKVTCVDVTPTDRNKENIFGKIDCKWRSVAGGEMQVFGIQSTPTLLIDKGDGNSLKKVEGLVDMNQLRSFLLEGRL